MSSASGTDRASYVRKVIVRNPDALFFTSALPLLFLVVYAGLNGGQHFHELGQPGKITMYARLVASVIVMTVVSGAFADLTIFLVRDREQGVLKRLRRTPVPIGVFLGGHLVNAMLTSMVLALLVGTLGWAAFEASLAGHVLAAVVTVLAGALACGAAGFALTSCVRTLNAAGTVVQAAVWTLFFFSGIFFTLSSMPVVVRALANAVPGQPLLRGHAHGLQPERDR